MPDKVSGLLFSFIIGIESIGHLGIDSHTIHDEHIYRVKTLLEIAICLEYMSRVSIKTFKI